jgi:uncharacterized protein
VIFADTSFWVALRNRRDTNHEHAKELLHRHGATRIVTTNHVRGETWTFLQRRAGHRAAVDFLDMIDASHYVDVEFVTRDLEERALRWLRRHDEREYSFVDATSFAFMTARRLRMSLAFDGDFTAAGFTELRL